MVKNVACAASALVLISSTNANARPVIEAPRAVALSGGRSSTTGASAALQNPAAMNDRAAFELVPIYQTKLSAGLHSFGVVAMDAANNGGRLALGAYYFATLGKPQFVYSTPDAQKARASLTLTGHEAGIPIAITAVKSWLTFAVTPKIQHVQLTGRDQVGKFHVQPRYLRFGLDAYAHFTVLRVFALSLSGENLVGSMPTLGGKQHSFYLGQRSVRAGSVHAPGLTDASLYPLQLNMSASVFPLRSRRLSVNFDSSLDFTSFRQQDAVRQLYGASLEVLAGAAPLRVGGYFDSGGQGSADDRGFISAGAAFRYPPPPATRGRRLGAGFELGFGFRRQVSGPQPDTLLSAHLGLLL